MAAWVLNILLSWPLQVSVNVPLEEARYKVREVYILSVFIHTHRRQTLPCYLALYALAE